MTLPEIIKSESILRSPATAATYTVPAATLAWLEAAIACPPPHLAETPRALEIDSLEVLVVDADAATASTISGVLEQMGLESVHVQDGYDANFEFYHRKPALVTLDLNLTGMHGLEVIHNIKAMPNHSTKILVVSDAVPSQLAKAKAAGADAVLSKPVDQDSLKRMVRILLGLNS